MVRSVNHREKYVVLDVETTGLSPWKGDRVIEVGAVALEGGDLMAEFSTLIQVPRNIPFSASQINGITDEMLIGQPTPEEVFPALEVFIGDSTLVAHNAQFDLGFLRHEYKLLGKRFHYPHVYTLQMSRSLYPQLINLKLETVYRHLMGRMLGWDTLRLSGTCSGSPKGSERVPGTENELHPRKQTHRALDDARMVVRIWLATGGR